MEESLPLYKMLSVRIQINSS